MSIWRASLLYLILIHLPRSYQLFPYLYISLRQSAPQTGTLSWVNSSAEDARSTVYLFTPKVPFSILCTRLSLVDRQGFMHPLLKWFWLTGLVSAQGSLGASCICWRSLESLIMDTFKSLHLSFPGHIILTDASSLGYVGCAHCFNIRELIFCFTCLGVSIMVWIPQCTSPVVVSLWRQWLLPPRLIGQPLLRNLLTSWFRQIMPLWKLMLQKVFDQWFY